MERVMFPLYIWAVCATFLVGITSSWGEHWRLLEKPMALFIFGDSIFDAGNRIYTETCRYARPPYGETFFGFHTGRATTAVQSLISSVDLSTIGSVDRGSKTTLPLIISYRILELSGKDSISRSVRIVLVACGLYQKHMPLGAETLTAGRQVGSVCLASILDSDLKVINLNTQLSNLKNVEKQLRNKLGGEEATALLSTSVYLFSIGGNDYFPLFQKNSSFFESQYVREEFVGMVIGNLTNVIQEIYNRGGRKFGFLNLTPIGCLPFVKSLEPVKPDGCVEVCTEEAKLHNRALSEALQELESQLTGFKYSMHDFFTSFSERSKKPSKYGFSSRGSVAKGYELFENPSDFLYFDSVHPTEKAYEQIAKLFWSGNSDITGPYNLKSLFELDNKCRFSLSSK